MRTVISKDGTTIAFDQSGAGPALLLVSGALGVSSHPMGAQLVELLAQRFTVYHYDRRGRGDSGDTPPYAVAREVEDIEALIDDAGGSAYVYGLSSGAVLALEAACRLPHKVKKLALYEPPLIIDDSRPPVPKDYVEQLNAAIAAGRPGDAVEIFMTKALLIPAEFVAQMRNAPMGEVFDTAMKPPEWVEMEKVAHTLAYDGVIMGETMSGKPLPVERVKQWAAATMPTLVVTGELSEPFFHDGAQALVAVLPNALRRILQGQHHAVEPAALAPMLVEFFTNYTIEPIGVIRSELTTLEAAPLQGDEDAPEVWLELTARVAPGLAGTNVGDKLIVLTWLHRARRDVLQVHPRGRRERPLAGVFATRSPDRPNPVGLHQVSVLEIAGQRLRVAPMEAIDGTPIVDLKPVLARPDDR